jgi:hypothetical protein
MCGQPFSVWDELARAVARRLTERETLRPAVLPVLIIATCVVLVGCQKWTPIENPRPVLEEQVAVEQSERSYFRFHTGTSPTVMGQVAAIDEDSVWLGDGPDSGAAVPLDDQTVVELMGTDWVSTGFGVLGIAALAGVFVYAISDACCTW